MDVVVDVAVERRGAPSGLGDLRVFVDFIFEVHLAVLIGHLSDTVVFSLQGRLIDVVLMVARFDTATLKKSG